MPHEITIDQLAEGDIVFAIGGRWRPFPHIVSKVVTTVSGGDRRTEVRFEGGGVIPRCESTTVVLIDGLRA